MLSNEEVIGLANCLQNEVRRSSNRTCSRSSIIEDVWMIFFVIKQIRCACLLSKLQTDQETINALKNALISYDNRLVKNLIIVIHHESKQTFIVNRTLFHERMKSVQSFQGLAFFAVDNDAGEERVEEKPPGYLGTMLEEVLRQSSEFSLRDYDDKNSLQIISLQCETNRKSSRDSIAALTGIALAGWMLEYSLVYFYKNIQCESFKAITLPLSDEIQLQSLDQENEDDWIPSEALQQNNLSGKELIIFSVNLQWSNMTEKSRNIIQFTIPSILIKPMAQTIGLKGDNVNSIADHLQDLFTSRLTHLHTTYTPNIHVTTKRIKLDRVAI